MGNSTKIIDDLVCATLFSYVWSVDSAVRMGIWPRDCPGFKHPVAQGKPPKREPLHWRTIDCSGAIEFEASRWLECVRMPNISAAAHDSLPSTWSTDNLKTTDKLCEYLHYVMLMMRPD